MLPVRVSDKTAFDISVGNSALTSTAIRLLRDMIGSHIW